MQRLIASLSKDFSGAEIEQVIYKVMQNGFSRNEEFTMGDLLEAIASYVPLKFLNLKLILLNLGLSSKFGLFVC